MNGYRINGRSISQYNRIQPYLSKFKFENDRGTDDRDVIEALCEAKQFQTTKTSASGGTLAVNGSFQDTGIIVLTATETTPT